MYDGRSINSQSPTSKNFDTYCKDNSMTYVDKKIKHMATLHFTTEA